MKNWHFVWLCPHRFHILVEHVIRHAPVTALVSRAGIWEAQRARGAMQTQRRHLTNLEGVKEGFLEETSALRPEE